MTLHVGFTGTKRKLKPDQELWIMTTLGDLYSQMDADLVLHHGDCINADAYAHSTAMNLQGFAIEIHPPSNDKYRAYCEGASFTHQAKGYWARNRDIIKSCSLLLAVPGTPYRINPRTGQPAGGTWYTVMRGIDAGREIHICPQ